MSPNGVEDSIEGVISSLTRGGIIEKDAEMTEIFRVKDYNVC